MSDLEFMRDFRRYCDANGSDARYIMMLNSDEEIVNGVKEWSEQHPFKTNFDKLREVFPGFYESCLPCPAATHKVRCGDITKGTNCKLCTEKFWNSEYKENNE